jgi:hypothetical protein
MKGIGALFEAFETGTISSAHRIATGNVSTPSLAAAG